MKNQYFADKRDYFKYDLLLYLVEHVPSFQRLTSIPMLTPDEGGGDGGKTGYQQGQADGRVFAFLKDCLARETRDILLLRDFFAQCNVDYVPYKDDDPFTHERRREYFAGIPDVALRQSLVFLDPDNGLEVSSMSARTGHKYVTYSEVRELLSRMGPGSGLVIFQMHHRKPAQEFFGEICQRLCRDAGAESPVCVSDGQLAFFLAANEETAKIQLRDSSCDYASSRGRMFYDWASAEKGVVQPTRQSELTLEES